MRATTAGFGSPDASLIFSMTIAHSRRCVDRQRDPRRCRSDHQRLLIAMLRRFLADLHHYRPAISPLMPSLMSPTMPCDWLLLWCRELPADRVESRIGAVAWLRFLSPLIKPDVRISRIRLSDW